ncbi:MAG: tRNA uridine-5-carboxymethylaminomethyl(34) synthesis GTPase MnmE [Acidobacteriia bacterium]|nr:tRNA uridine-5-carboxymethylaminomethyl(34) synthesis GTPase MnmE [Terriglobia bacterium]
MTNTEDTIVAVATPPGRGGLGVVRLSGERAEAIATELIRFAKLPLETQRATVGEFYDPQDGRVLDQVVVTCFRRPHSYTAEDVVEIACHGSPVILKFLVELCLKRGARVAEPGEFTMRAFLNGRIDLTQAEAIRDLIESRTLYQARVAAQQMEGAVSARLKPHKQTLMDLIARLEAGIDFAEDDVSVMEWPEVLARLDAIRADLGKLVEGYEYGRIVREGLSLAIVGRPNVGKSSLFNRLLNEDRAIVTATPGTTRDLVAESAQIGGIPLRFVDTAGIREAHDEAERIGVEKSWQAIADSDLRLLVIDASEPWTDADSALLSRLQPLGALLVALNKSDLPPQISSAEMTERLPSSAGDAASRVEIVETSALTGAGVPKLREEILALAVPVRDLGGEEEFITSLRQQQLLKESLQALFKARQAAELQVHHELLLLDLYDALRALDTLTGATNVEDLLGIIFSTFCVGK